MQACNMLKEKTFTRQNAARCFLMCSLMDFLLLTVSDENSSLLMCVEIFSRELSERKKPLMMAFMLGVRYEVKIMMKFLDYFIEIMTAFGSSEEFI